MFRFIRKSAALSAVFLLLFQTVVWAASNTMLSGVRYHNGSRNDRIVFDLDKMPSYTVRTEQGGKRIVLEFSNVKQGKGLKKPKISSSRIKQVSYAEKNGKLIVSVDLPSALKYKAGSLKNPARVFLDVFPAGTSAPAASASSASKPRSPEEIEQVELAPGLKQTTYIYHKGEDRLKAWFLFADKNKYTLKPVLANSQIPGRDEVSDVSDDVQAVAAVNASYFSYTGEILGITKIDGSLAGTTYFKRSAIGILPDGRAVFGQVGYNGTVTIRKVTLPVSGVDTERGENGLVLYNYWYGNNTRTNEYGLEFTVQNGKVTHIQTGNSRIPKGGVVVSVHGSSMAAFARVREGDSVDIKQDLGEPWNQAVQILGAGPCLVKDGRIHVTAAEEQFPSDIRYGDAPRSAVGVTKNGDFILAVVDGRQDHSDGCTLTEWAQLLQKFGAVDAINLDGGGSTALVVGGVVQNSPSDGEERAVGSVLALLKK